MCANVRASEDNTQHQPVLDFKEDDDNLNCPSREKPTDQASNDISSNELPKKGLLNARVLLKSRHGDVN